MLNDADFNHLIQQHAREIIEYLMDKGIAFSILCNVKKLSFSPLLPELEKLPDFSLFVLVGYTFDSLTLYSDDLLVFEAGFGEKNEGSIVSVPLNSIIQIFLHNPNSPNNEQESLIFINLRATLNDPLPKESCKGVDHSMKAFLQNPENQHLTK